MSECGGVDKPYDILRNNHDIIELSDMSLAKSGIATRLPGHEERPQCRDEKQ